MCLRYVILSVIGVLTSGIWTSLINLAAKFSSTIPSEAAKNASTWLTKCFSNGDKDSHCCISCERSTSSAEAKVHVKKRQKWVSFIQQYIKLGKAPVHLIYIMQMQRRNIHLTEEAVEQRGEAVCPLISIDVERQLCISLLDDSVIQSSMTTQASGIMNTYN